MSEVKRLVVAIIQFLNEQRELGQLTSDAKESLEVAVQCLESAFGVSLEDSSLASSKSLMQVFADGMGDGVSSGASLPPEPSEADKNEAEKLKVEGNTCMRADKHAEALDYYTKAIQLDGRNAVYYCNRAAAYNQLGKHMEAIDDCKMALQIDPSYSKAFGRMGLAYTSLNRLKEARECYQKALQMEPDNESYRNYLMSVESQLTRGRGAGSLPGLAGLAGLGRGGGGGGGGGGGFPGMVPGMDLGNLLNNPSLMNMASQLLSDPNMQNLMTNIMAGNVNQGGSGMEALLQAGQQLAQQMQNANPQLVEQLRQQMGQTGGGNNENSSRPDDPSSDGMEGSGDGASK